MKGRVRALSRDFENRQQQQTAPVVPARPSSRGPARQVAEAQKPYQETVQSASTKIVSQENIPSYTARVQQASVRIAPRTIPSSDKHMDDVETRLEAAMAQIQQSIKSSQKFRSSNRTAHRRSVGNLSRVQRGDDRVSRTARCDEYVSPTKNRMSHACNMTPSKISPSPESNDRTLIGNGCKMSPESQDAMVNRAKHNVIAIEQGAVVSPNPQHSRSRVGGLMHTPSKVVNTRDRVNVSPSTGAMVEARKITFGQQPSHQPYGRCLAAPPQSIISRSSSVQVLSFNPGLRTPPSTTPQHAQTVTTAVCFGARHTISPKKSPMKGLTLSPKKSPVKGPVLQHSPRVEVASSRASLPGADIKPKPKRLVRCPSAPTARTYVDPDSADQIFLRFLSEPKAQEALQLFQTLLKKAGLHEEHLDGKIIPYHHIRQLPLGWRAKELLKILDAKVSKSRIEVGAHTKSRPLRALVVGGGPIGMRVAIELRLSGHEVQVLEKRMNFSRINRLHLWDWCKHDLRELGIKHFDPPGPGFGVDPDYCHIGIGELQSTLFKVSLLLGVRFIFGHEYVGIQHSGNSWSAQVKKNESESLSLPFDVLLGADGANSSIAKTPGVDTQLGRVEFGLKKGSAIGLVANFIGQHGVRQFSWARQFAEKKFADLEQKHGVTLENCVYYRSGLQHYLVMTPTAASLISKGVFEDPTKEDLTAGRNVRKEKVREIAQCAAEHFGLPRMEFAPAPDDAMLFDFSGIKRAQSGCAFVSSEEAPEALVMLVGDALLQPFWPEGLGIMRGFLSALDAVAAINAWGGNDAEAARRISFESFAKLKTLCGKTAGMVLQKDIKKYSLDPRTRYRAG